MQKPIFRRILIATFWAVISYCVGFLAGRYYPYEPPDYTSVNIISAPYYLDH